MQITLLPGEIARPTINKMQNKTHYDLV